MSRLPSCPLSMFYSKGHQRHGKLNYCIKDLSVGRGANTGLWRGRWSCQFWHFVGFDCPCATHICLTTQHKHVLTHSASMTTRAAQPHQDSDKNNLHHTRTHCSQAGSTESGVWCGCQEKVWHYFNVNLILNFIFEYQKICISSSCIVSTIFLFKKGCLNVFVFLYCVGICNISVS